MGSVNIQKQINSGFIQKIFEYRADTVFITSADGSITYIGFPREAGLSQARIGWAIYRIKTVSSLKTVYGIPKDQTLSGGVYSEEPLFVMDDCATYTYSQDS